MVQKVGVLSKFRYRLSMWTRISFFVPRVVSLFHSAPCTGTYATMPAVRYQPPLQSTPHLNDTRNHRQHHHQKPQHDDDDERPQHEHQRNSADGLLADETKPSPTTQSTENMLVNAANVDPFLEGRRPRHVWSHQLRPRAPAPASTVTAADKVNGSTCTSCLGPGGEQALFESLSSGGEGAFVAWVKGGHETRQECKRLVVDVLDLLAAPGGQKPSFFQRGAQAKRAPGGRVGIAAKGKSAATAGVVAGGEEGQGGRIPPVSSGSHQNGGDHLMMVVKGDGDDAVEAGATVVSDSTVVEDSNGRGRGGDRAILDEGEVGRGDGGAAAAEGGGSGLTYGYASLRRIRERDPLPEVARARLTALSLQKMYLRCQAIGFSLTACTGKTQAFFVSCPAPYLT